MRVPFVNRRYTKGVPGLHKGKGLDLGAEPPGKILCCVPPIPRANSHIRGL